MKNTNCTSMVQNLTSYLKVCQWVHKSPSPVSMLYQFNPVHSHILFPQNTL